MPSKFVPHELQFEFTKEILMKRILLALVCGAALIVGGAPAFAQLSAPNAAGVSLGAVYYTVPDVEAHKKIWVDNFNAKPIKVGNTEMLKIPGVFIVPVSYTHLTLP